MIRVIKFVLDTKDLCLKVQPNFDSKKFWKLKEFSENDWAGDPETRISVTGCIAYLQNVPVCYCSKAQRGVTLSSSEAEYVAMSEAVKDIRFIYFILCDIGIKVDLPIVVKTAATFYTVFRILLWKEHWEKSNHDPVFNLIC